MNSTAEQTFYCPFIPLSSYSWQLRFQYKANCYGTHLPWNPAVYCIITAFHAITFWVATGLILKVFVTFKSWKTLYFW
jgi:hypothetical protein